MFLGGSWREWAVVWFVIVAVMTGAAWFLPRGVSYPQLTCMSNASELTHCYILARREQRFDATLHGSAQILSWLGKDGMRFGQERVFFCPGDDDAEPPETDDERRAFHPADAAALRAARGLGSYAVRDFERCPIDPASTEKQPILCDREGADGRTPHHENVIVVTFAEGDVQKFTREQLGIAPSEPIVVGPDSPSPLLRVFERP
jgi:hypothetical protein